MIAIVVQQKDAIVLVFKLKNCESIHRLKIKLTCDNSKLIQIYLYVFLGGLWVESEAELMADIDAASTKFSKCTWPGEVLAGALYTLNCCPIHSRYLRKGLGQHKPLQQSEFMMTPKEVRRSRLV